MRMKSTNDGWLPAWIKVLGDTITGEQVVLGYRDPWPSNGWFDRNNNKYPDRYVISN